MNLEGNLDLETGETPELRPRSRVVSGIRLTVALALLSALLMLTGTRELLSVLLNLDLALVLVLLAISAVLIWLSSLKWQLFVRAGGHDVKIVPLMRWYTMAYFVNTFLPSAIGGDVARSLALGRQTGHRGKALAATFVERYTGFLAMTLLGVFFVAFGADAAAGFEYAILALAFVTSLLGFFLFSENASRHASALLGTVLGRKAPRLNERIQRILRKGEGSVECLRGRPRLFANALILSLAFHFGAVVNTYICALAVGWTDADFPALCIVVPLALLVGTIPVTPGGVGIVEGAFMFFLVQVGASQPQALGIGLVLRAKNILVALVGWMIWLYEERRLAVERKG